MKEIQLSRGLKAKVDDEDYEWLNQWKWFVHEDKRSSRLYAKAHGKTVSGKRSSLSMHRLILNPPEGMETDHIDMDGLNNQRYNLRACSKQQNAHNRESYVGSSSKYKGVHWNKGTKHWHAHIRVDKKLKYIGYFDNEEDAAKAYNRKATELFGEFARVNPITI